VFSGPGLKAVDLRTTNRPDDALQKPLARKNNKNQKRSRSVFSSAKRQSEYQTYRVGTTDRTGSISSMPILIGAAMISAAILLSTLISALGTRYVGIEGPSEESAWLVDRLTGTVYKCQAQVRGRASCESNIATGSIPERSKP
jgi:hypothetical protein